jgi:hypothetical protein
MSILTQVASGLVKWVVIGIVAIVMICIFFIGYGGFFIPLLMVAAIALFILASGATKTTPLWQILIFILVAFFLTYAVQRLCVYGLSSTFNVQGEISDLGAGLVAAFVSGFVLMLLIFNLKVKGGGLKYAFH